MVSLEKMVSLARESRFDSTGPENNSDIDLQKVFALGDATKHDICVSSASPRKVKGLDRIGDVARGGVCHSFSHDGRCVSMFKTLFTNECTHQCAYCSNSSTCKKKRQEYTYEPKEMADIFMKLYRGNNVEGLFLSSGVGKDEHATMEKMIESVRYLRDVCRFAGYVHLKILPGADKDHLKDASDLADRVSVNLEVPSEDYMDIMSPSKDYVNDILRRQRYISRIVRRNKLPAGQTTQMVVGGAGETDREIFDSAVREYNDLEMKRVYYSAFLPVEGTSLEKEMPQPSWREHRLYQLDWLYRVYDMDNKELALAFNDDENLSNDDPKIVIARQSLENPIDPNSAPYKELLKVPGIGPVSARRIVNVRKMNKIRTRRELQYLGVRTKRASPYLCVGGWQESLLDRWMK